MNDSYPIYKKVDGKLVQISERDPKRRYSIVAMPKGNYHLEYTAEEEKARDEEEAKWEAEKPQRAEEQRKKEEEAKKFKDSLEYEERFVVFWDILGWGRAIEKSISDPELTKKLGVALQTYAWQVKMSEWSKEYQQEGDYQITHFSDCIVLSFKADKISARMVPFYLNGIISNFLIMGFFIRGAVTVGPLIHKGTMVYGPALLRAHYLESEVADIPRIILDKPLAKVWGKGTKYLDMDGSTLGYEREWRKDDDGWFFYDFLKPWPSSPGTQLSTMRIDLGLRAPQQYIATYLQEYKGVERVEDKYIWLAKYFDKILDEYPQTTHKKFNLN